MVADSAPKLFTDFTVYKGKGAVSLKVIKPTWVKSGTGSSISVGREGTVLLEFANSQGEKNYDWENKGTFALSALECAEVLEALESGRDRSFYHDPSKGSNDEGQVSKSFKLSPARDQGFFLNLGVKDNVAGRNASYGTALSAAEARVMRRLMDFAIPRLLGFDEMFAGVPDIRDNDQGSSQAPF
ncbi:hypothetical protein N2152v2_006090 [Parachlorella kessleri]